MLGLGPLCRGVGLGRLPEVTSQESELAETWKELLKDGVCGGGRRTRTISQRSGCRAETVMIRLGWESSDQDLGDTEQEEVGQGQGGWPEVLSMSWILRSNSKPVV